jgi:ketosteroid isomerase-like protein
MRISYALVLVATLATPATAVAADENLKQVVDNLASAFNENFNKQNSAAIAAMFTNGGMLIGDAGQIKNIAEYYEGAFKAGLNHHEAIVDQVQPLGTDSLIATGEYRITGKSESGTPLELSGFWTGVDVREGGTWKVRLLTAVPKAPPPPQK